MLHDDGDTLIDARCSADLPLVLQPNHAKRGGGANGQGEKKGISAVDDASIKNDNDFF